MVQRSCRIGMHLTHWPKALSCSLSPCCLDYRRRSCIMQSAAYPSDMRSELILLCDLTPTTRPGQPTLKCSVSPVKMQSWWLCGEAHPSSSRMVGFSNLSPVFACFLKTSNRKSTCRIPGHVHLDKQLRDYLVGFWCDGMMRRLAKHLLSLSCLTYAVHYGKQMKRTACART